MENTNFIIIVTLFIVVSCIPNGSDSTRPFVAGTPPQNAYTGLVLLEDGEIRHYSPNMYISSTDKGNTWDTVFVS